MAVCRGEIYTVELSPTRGSEMKFDHPCIIVSSDSINKAAAVVIVCPITDAIGKHSPIHIPIPKGESGLTKDSIAHCGQIRSIDKERLKKKWGDLQDARMKTIDAGIKLALAL